MAQPDPLSDLAAPARRVLAAARCWMAALALPVLALLAVLTALQYRQAMQQAERELLHQAGRHAQTLRQLAQPAIDHVHDLRALLQVQWPAPPDAGPALRQALQPQRAAGQPDGWSLDQASTAQRERLGQVWWASSDGQPAPEAWLQRAAGFVAQARVAHARAPAFEATWFAGTDTNTAFGYPWLPTSSITRAMGTPGLRAIAALRDEATGATRQWMSDHPGQTTFWSPPAISQLHRQLVVSHGALVLIAGAYRGEVSVDFRLDALQQRAAAWAAESGLPGARLWLVDSGGQVLADAVQPLPTAPALAPVNTPLDTALSGRLPAGLGADAAARALREPGRLWQLPGWRLVAERPADAPWAVLMAVPLAPLQAQVAWQLLPNGLIALALLLMFGAAQWLLARHFIAPAVRALAYGRALARDPQATAPQLGRRWRPWVDATTEVFRTQRALLLRDQTERLQAREQIERQREALRQSEKLGAMGRLLAGVAHELNNPLAIVLGRAALLEERHPQASVQADARRIREAAERCGRIVHTFLNMARARPAQRAPVALNDLVRGAADLLAYTWRSHGITLQLRLADDLAPAWADGDPIGQVVLNLLVNAQQALVAMDQQALGMDQPVLVGRPAPLQVLVSTGCDPAAGGRPAQVWLQVDDSGPGVPPAAQTLIFEPFFTTKPEGLGTGLGLALSRALLREQGGELTLQPRSALGGACLRLTLPVAPPDNGASLHGSARPAGDQPGAGDPGPVSAARILVIDDEPGIASLMRDMLEDAGHEVAVAGSGADALEMLSLAGFDAIVSDLRMPGTDGASLWRSIRQQHPALANRLLFVTGDTLSPASQAFLASTGCPALDKPFTQAALLAAVARLLRIPKSPSAAAGSGSRPRP